MGYSFHFAWFATEICLPIPALLLYFLMFTSGTLCLLLLPLLHLLLRFHLLHHLWLLVHLQIHHPILFRFPQNPTLMFRCRKTIGGPRKSVRLLPLLLGCPLLIHHIILSPVDLTSYLLWIASNAETEPLRRVKSHLHHHYHH